MYQDCGNRIINPILIDVTNDLPEEKTLTLTWKIVDTSGAIIESGSKSGLATPLSNTRFHELDVQNAVAQYDLDDCIVWLEIEDQNTIISTNQVFLQRPKRLLLSNPELSYDIVFQNEDTIDILVSSKTLALWVWLDARDSTLSYSDNFFHLTPEKPREVTINFDATIEEAPKFQLRSMYDVIKH